MDLKQSHICKVCKADIIIKKDPKFDIWTCNNNYCKAQFGKEALRDKSEEAYICHSCNKGIITIYNEKIGMWVCSHCRIRHKIDTLRQDFKRYKPSPEKVLNELQYMCDLYGLCYVCGVYGCNTHNKKPPTKPPTEEKNNINHPSHYGGDTLYEVIKVTEAWEELFNIGSHIVTAITYIARAKSKGKELEDLKKAKWYLTRRIKQLEDKENK